MRRALVIITTGLAAALTMLSAAAQQALWPPADMALMHSARLWELHDRGDLAQLALEKLISARPDLPQALVELGELDIRIGELAGAAKVLARIQTRFKDTPEARDFETEYRVATRDRLQLALIRRMFETRRGAQARAALAALFPRGAPDNAMGIEYYRLLAGTPNGWLQACQGLQHLIALHPDDPHYQLALARHLLRRDERELEGVMLLHRLSQRDDLRVADVDQLLAEAFRDMSPLRIPSQVLRAYLLRHPDDPAVQEILARQRRAIEQQRLLASNALSSIEPALQLQLLQTMQATLAQHSRDAAAARALQLARTLAPEQDGTDVPEVPLNLAYDDAALEADLWRRRSRQSERAQQTRAAEAELRAAIAFHSKHFEAAIDSADELERLQRSQESGALLESAGRLDPQSGWLFESRIRWLNGHAMSDAALALLQHRPTGRKWSAAARDQLMAVTLDRRATERMAAGNADGALDDLERAIALSPQDPWMRYRLAGMYHTQHMDERGVELMRAGARAAPDDAQMRYAQALYLSSLDDYAGALAALGEIEVSQRSANMDSLRDRMRIAIARARAREFFRAGDTEAARNALLEVEPLSTDDIDRARELAYSWIELGDPAHGLALLQPYLDGPAGSRRDVRLAWAQLLNSAEDDTRLAEVLQQLRGNALSEADQQEVARLTRALDMREIRALEREHRYAAAEQKLDSLLASEPEDRALRLARADLDLAMEHPKAARDLLAALVAEQPDDLDARLSYARALTDSGDLALARLQIHWVEEHLPADDIELRLGLSRRQLGVGDADAALITLQPLLATTATRTDTLLLAARAELALRHFAIARDYFQRAQAQSSGDALLAAQRARDDIDIRLQSSVATALQVLHQPGVAGISQLDVATIPSSWIFARNYEQRLTAHADAVSLQIGQLDTSFDRAATLGMVQAAGPNAPLRFRNDRQTGLALGAGSQTDSYNADVGTTPLGFDLPNIVGGVEWTPSWHGADINLGLARRALTSSALSYAGLRDPISGEKWGAVVANGPYANVGLYKEHYSLSGSLRFSELTGTHVESNQFLGARASGSWKFFDTGAAAAAYTGLTLNYWSYQHNLSNYTFGSGGYYSPHSYVSTSLPLELTGIRSGWSYQLRASVAYSVSDIAASAFYPNDPALQAAASRAALPSGFNSPVFGASSGGSFSISAYAAVERQITRGLVFGVMLDIDRTDFYHPTLFSLYLRHSLGAFDTPLASPPKVTRPYNQ